MSYAQIHTQALRHRKVLSLSAPAFRLWIGGHCYCQEHLTDGLIPYVALVALGVPVRPQWVRELVANTLWHEVPDGYQIHDWHDWNDSRKQVENRRIAAKDRREKWLAKRAADAVANGVSDAYPNGVDNGVDNGVANGSATQRTANATLTHRNAPQISSEVSRAGGASPAPLASRAGHKAHALCGQVCLPAFLYLDLVQWRGGDETEARAYVEAWWLRVDTELARGHPPIGDGLAYLRQRWATDHPTPKPAAKVASFDTKAWIGKGAS